MLKPAEQLNGLTIGSGWIVGPIVPRNAGDTGGFFSVGYNCVHEDKRRGFVKALDFSTALASADPISALQIMTAEYDFEREVLKVCESLSRIVVALEFGTHNLGDPGRAEPGDPGRRADAELHRPGVLKRHGLRHIKIALRSRR